MITYSYRNDANVSIQEREQAKQAWIEKIGIFVKEFDEKNGFVNIDFSIVEKDDDRYFSFSLPEPHNLSEFIERFNEWQLAGRPI